MTDHADVIREALPALHQLGPTCRCKSCSAHAAVSALEAERDKLSINNSVLFDHWKAAEAERDYWKRNYDAQYRGSKLEAAEARVTELEAALRLSKERATLILRLARSAGTGLDEKNALSKIEHEAEHWLGLVARAALVKEDTDE